MGNERLESSLVLQVVDGPIKGRHGLYFVACPIVPLAKLSDCKKSTWITFAAELWHDDPLPEKGEWIVGSRLRKKGNGKNYGWRVLSVRPYKPSDEKLLRKGVV